MALRRGSQPFDVRIEGLRDLRRDLRAIDRKLPTELNRRLKVAAQPVLRDAQGLVPVRSGRLRSSLKIRTGGSKLYIGSNLPYARVVHWGGRHPLFGNRNHWYRQAPRPFIQRAVARNGKDVEKAVMRTVEGLMRDAGFH